MAGAFEKVMDSRKELVEKVIRLMEEGYHNNHRAWTLQGGVPYNPESQVTYRGGNRLRLMIAEKEAGYKDSRWMTFRQIQKAGYRLKKDQHGILCEKWIFETKVKTQTEDGQEIEEIKELDRPKVSYFYVFNAEQVEGYPDLPIKEYEPDIMKIGDLLIKSSECPVYEVPQDSAYYNKSADHIVIPARYQFKDAKSFVATLVHEMGHSTGHPGRLNRKFGAKFGDEDYAKEELRAELGALFIESDLELDPSGEVLEDHSDYLLSWIGALRKDPNELFRACADAEKISERIIHNYKLYIQQENLSQNEIVSRTENVSADEAAYHLDQESYLYVQTSEGGYDYTFFDRFFKEIDGGQLDNSSLNIEAARDEILALHEISPELIEQIPIEEYERLPELIGKEPTVTINISESGELEEGTVLPFSKANSLFEQLDRQTRERYGTDQYYDKTDFTIEYVEGGRIHTYTGRQDLGDLDGSLADHILKNATTYLNDPTYQEYLLKQGKEVQEQTNAGYEDIIQEFVPYLKLHENLALMEQQAAEAVKQMTQKNQGTDMHITENMNYYASIIDYVRKSRIELNTAVVPQLPDMPQPQNNIKDDTEEYREQVEKEIEQEAHDAGMTVEEYAANGYELSPSMEVHPAVQPDNLTEEAKDELEKAAVPCTTIPYYTINENAARRAKAAYSMTDYKEGSATAEYRHYVDEAVELADQQKKKVDPMYYKKIDHLVDLYARKLAENMNHRFEIEARVPSILVSGGANFPVRQKEKQVAAEESNHREWKEIQGLLNKLRKEMPDKKKIYGSRFVSLSLMPLCSWCWTQSGCGGKTNEHAVSDRSDRHHRFCLFRRDGRNP